MRWSMSKVCALWFLWMGALWAAEPPVRGVFNAETELHRYAGCSLTPTEWADGDSFAVCFPDGKDYAIRLYGADCLETSG